MRRLYGLLMIFIFLISCGPRIEEVVEETFDDGSPKIIKHYITSGDQKEMVKEIAYYPNNQLRFEGEYDDGKRDGYWIYWYENGNTWSEGYFKDGKRDGPGKTYHENGELYVDGNYEDDKRVGKWSFYDDKGELIKNIDYDI